MKLLKEWAIVCKALEEGRQIFLARKGGIAEEEGEFVLTDKEFYLFPGYLHQNKECLNPNTHFELDFIAGQEPKDGKIHLRSFARVTDCWRFTDFAALQKLDKEHIWSEQFIRQRFEWGNFRGITLIVLRVYRFFDQRQRRVEGEASRALPVGGATRAPINAEIILPMRPEYGGCKSWVNIEKEINLPAMVPVLSDLEFNEKRERLNRLR